MPDVLRWLQPGAGLGRGPRHGCTFGESEKRRHRQPYAWLGAGAIAVGIGAAALAGAGVASADDASSSSSDSDNARVGSPRASAESQHRGDRQVKSKRSADEKQPDTGSRRTVRVRNFESAERVALRTPASDDLIVPSTSPWCRPFSPRSDEVPTTRRPIALPHSLYRQHRPTPRRPSRRMSTDLTPPPARSASS